LYGVVVLFRLQYIVTSSIITYSLGVRMKGYRCPVEGMLPQSKLRKKNHKEQMLENNQQVIGK
jgi:hypothetical protein